MNTLMECGHTAQGTNAEGNPICIICYGTYDGSTVVAKVIPDLTGRTARCTCLAEDKIRPSSTDLAFFEYRGEGSQFATKTCGNCGFHSIAHVRKAAGEINHPRICDTFTPVGAHEFDLYYCGHGGWD